MTFSRVRRTLRLASALLALAAVYFIAGKLGLRLAFVHASATAVWPPTGIALAALLLLGYRAWPAVLLGAFAVNATTAGSPATAMGIALGNTLEALVGTFLVNKFAHGRHAFDRAQDVFKFAILAGFLSTTVSATIGVGSLAVGGYAAWERVATIWWTWWLGDVAGDLIVAPLLVLWGTNRERLGQARLLEAALLALAITAIGGTVFAGFFTSVVKDYPLMFLCLPPLIWAAFRFGQREAATAIALLSGIAIWGTLNGLGPFVSPAQNESLLLLQAFMATTAMTIVPLAAVVAEHRRLEATLADVAAIVESSEDAIVGKTLDGVITGWNAGAERLYGYSAAEALGRPISIVIPDELRDELPKILEQVGQGAWVDHYETIRMRKDGTRLEVSVTVSPIRDVAGRIIGASSIARDISERKAVEAACRERNTLRSVMSLAAAAAHEINNPLMVLLGHVEFLAGEVDGVGRRRIDEIVAAIRRIQEIVVRMNRIERVELTEPLQDLPEMMDLRKSSPDTHPSGGV